jgi:hypothetical protein
VLEVDSMAIPYLTNKDVAGSGPCALVTSLNALLFYKRPLPSPEEIDQLVDLVRCRYGAALCIEEGRDQLGLTTEEGPVEKEWVNSHLEEGRCVDIGGFSPDWGCHSSLAVGLQDGRMLLVNWVKSSLILPVLWEEIKRPWFWKPVVFWPEEKSLTTSLKRDEFPPFEKEKSDEPRDTSCNSGFVDRVGERMGTTS